MVVVISGHQGYIHTTQSRKLRHHSPSDVNAVLGDLWLTAHSSTAQPDIWPVSSLKGTEPSSGEIVT